MVARLRFVPESTFDNSAKKLHNIFAYPHQKKSKHHKRKKGEMK
jgi:hypothetical protein